MIAEPLNEPPRFDPISPEVMAARVIKKMEYAYSCESGVREEDLMLLLEEQGKAVAGGDLACVSRIMTAQLHILERLSGHLIGKAMAASAHLEVAERYLRLALLAEALCVRTGNAVRKIHEHPPRMREEARSGVDAGTASAAASASDSEVREEAVAAEGTVAGETAVVERRDSGLGGGAAPAGPLVRKGRAAATKPLELAWLERRRVG